MRQDWKANIHTDVRKKRSMYILCVCVCVREREREREGGGGGGGGGGGVRIYYQSFTDSAHFNILKTDEVLNAKPRGFF